MCRATQKQARAYPRTPAQLQYSRPRAWVEREEKRMAKAFVRSLGQGLRASPFCLRASAWRMTALLDGDSSDLVCGMMKRTGSLGPTSWSTHISSPQIPFAVSRRFLPRLKDGKCSERLSILLLETFSPLCSRLALRSWPSRLSLNSNGNKHMTPDQLLVHFFKTF